TQSPPDCRFLALFGIVKKVSESESAKDTPGAPSHKGNSVGEGITLLSWRYGSNLVVENRAGC
ncbi:MAG: hypothetical protein ABW120_14750, partial [Sedimenticola sp.]